MLDFKNKLKLLDSNKIGGLQYEIAGQDCWTAMKLLDSIASNEIAEHQ